MSRSGSTNRNYRVPFAKSAEQELECANFVAAADGRVEIVPLDPETGQKMVERLHGRRQGAELDTRQRAETRKTIEKWEGKRLHHR